MTVPVEDIEFTGRDGYECEGFVRAIRKVAYAAGRIRDDAWTADFASTCFSGRALRYYESLELEVQCDWRLLRHALLTKYPRPDDDEDELLSEASRTSQIYIPAAVLGPTLQPRVGRIKVIGANSTDFDYIGFGKASNSSELGAGAPATEASTFSYVAGSKLFEIQIKMLERPGEKDQVLGVHWYSPAPSTAIGSLNFAGLTVFSYEGSHRSSKMTWGGPGCTRIWNILPDNTLSPHLEEGARRTPLQFFMHQKAEHPRHSIDVAADPGAFMTKYGDGWKLVKLVFEPLN